MTGKMLSKTGDAKSEGATEMRVVDIEAGQVLAAAPLNTQNELQVQRDEFRRHLLLRHGFIAFLVLWALIEIFLISLLFFVDDEMEKVVIECLRWANVVVKFVLILALYLKLILQNCSDSR